MTGVQERVVMANTAPLHIQYGCGLSCPEGWINFDASPTLRLQKLPLVGRVLAGRFGPRFPSAVRFGDIVRGLPVADGSARGVYASHVLEHLALADCHTALRNTLRLLAPGGIFRLLVPDLAFLVGEYQHSAGSPDAAKRFMEHSLLGQHHRPRGIGGRIRHSMGNSGHRWMWDHTAMIGALEQAGFTRIRRCAFGDCEDPAFAAVEDRGRFDAAVAVEARKGL